MQSSFTACLSSFKFPALQGYQFSLSEMDINKKCLDLQMHGGVLEVAVC